MNEERVETEGILIKTISGSKPVNVNNTELNSKPFFAMAYIRIGDEIEPEERRVEYSFSSPSELARFRREVDVSSRDYIQDHMLRVKFSYSPLPETHDTGIYQGDSLSFLNGHSSEHLPELNVFPLAK